MRSKIIIPAMLVIVFGLITGILLLPMSQKNEVPIEPVKAEPKCKMLELSDDSEFYQFDCGSYFSICDRQKDSRIQTYSGCMILTKPKLSDTIKTEIDIDNSTNSLREEKMKITLEKIFSIVENYPNKLTDEEVDVLISYAVGRGYNNIDPEVDEKAMDIMLKLIEDKIL